MKQKYTPTKIEIPPICFRYKSINEQIEVQELVTPLVKMEWNKGIFQYLEGAEYPMKGMASPETMWALNLAKRNFIQSLRLMSKWFFLPTYALIALLPWKKKVSVAEAFLKSYCDGTHTHLSPYILKSDYMTPLGQELEWVIHSFLSNLGISPTLCGQFSEIFAAMIDYDNAYRYRLGDIFSETTKIALMKNPVKEIKRLLGIIQIRENTSADIRLKYKFMATGLSIAMIHPKIRKAFKAAVSEIDVRKMALDEADRYWVCLRENNEYLFMGKTDEERKKIISGKSVPVLIKRNNYNG